MKFRPSIVPEPARPLVLAPIYLVRKFINAFLFFVIGVIIVTGIFTSTIPGNIVFLGAIIKSLISLAVFAGFVASAWGVHTKRKFLIRKLDRLEDLCAGDVRAAAGLAKDVAEDSVDWAEDKATELFDAVQEVDVQETAGNAIGFVTSVTSAVASTTRSGYQIIVDKAEDAGEAAVDVAEDAVEAASNAASAAATKTAGFAKWATGGAFNAAKNLANGAADETRSLLSDPMGKFGSIGQGAVEAGGNMAEAAVDAAENAGEVAMDTVEMTVNVGKDTAEVAVELGTDVAEGARQAGKGAAGKASKMTVRGIRRVMALDPIFIFKEVVRKVLRITLYIVLGLPACLFGLGILLWMFGIVPSFLQIALFVILLVIGVPATWMWVRKTALEQLDFAGAEVVRINTKKAASMASGVVSWVK